MALNYNKQEGDKLHAEEWNELVQEVQGKQPRLNIIDALDSTSSVDVLSAKQGKILNDKINSTLTDVETISEKVDKFPTGYYYGQFDSVNSLPDASQLTQKGYAYVASEDSSVYYIYLFDGEGSSWEDSGNKFVTTELETDLSTKSQTKAPTTEAVANGIEAVDVTLARSAEDENELTKTQKYNASANINDRTAEIVASEIKALGYRVLNPNQSFAEQVTAANTVYEIKDYFDISGTEQELAVVTIPANCKLRFEGGRLTGTNCKLIGNNTVIESNDLCITKGIVISGTWANQTVYTKWFELICADDAYTVVENETNGVMAPFFKENTYYKSGIDYRLLEGEPSNWQSNYSDYFEIINDEYTNVVGVAPEFTLNTYYELTEEGTYAILSERPDDWDVAYAKYFVKVNNDYEAVTGIYPPFEENRFYENAGEGYEKLLVQPTDWYYNWGNYYELEGTIYTTVKGIIDNPNATNNALVFKQLQAFINGTKGCKVEFEKGYYQAATSGKARGTVLINGDDYEMWPTNLYSKDEDVILNIFDLPYLDINLNGAKIKALRTNSPTWQLIRCNGVENLSIHDGELEGYANRFNYPEYWNRSTPPSPNSSGSISQNYEQVWLLMVAGGNCELYNLNIHNSTGNCVSVGKRLWKSGSNIKSYVLKSAHIHDCEFYDCGRNGMGMGNGEYVTLERLHIHHVGSSNGNLTKDPDTNIMGYLPMVGIDIESDEIKTLNPIVKWDSLRIHNCSSAAFAFAPASKSLMTSFYAYNLSIEGRCATETITTIEGLPKFESCFFEVTDSSSANADNYFRGKAIYERCTFVLKHFISAAKNTFINCIFKDEIDGDPSGVLCIKKASYDKSFYHTFQGCVLELKHSCYLDKSIIDNCEIIFKETDYVSNTLPLYEVRLNGSTIVNTTIRAVNEAQVRITSKGDGYGSGIDFINCNFINIRGRLSSTSITPYSSVDNTPFAVFKGILHFDKCKFEENNRRLAVYVGNNDSAKCIIENSYVKFSIMIFGSSNSTSDKNEAVISNTECGYLVLRSCHNISVNKSNFLTPTKAHFYGSNIQIDDCVATFNYPENSSQYPYSYNSITIENSIIEFKSDSYNNVTALTIKNSYIKGNGISELLYKGKVNNCKFETSIESSGDTRPAIRTNANIGFRFFDTTLNKPIYWNGTAWVDSNGETVGLQVNDTTVLIGASTTDTDTATINIYYGGSTPPTINILNADDTPCTWLTASPNPFTGNTLTLTPSSANTGSNPRGCKVIITLGDEVKIVNVVQNYSTT